MRLSVCAQNSKWGTACSAHSLEWMVSGLGPHFCLCKGDTSPVIWASALMCRPLRMAIVPLSFLSKNGFFKKFILIFIYLLERHREGDTVHLVVLSPDVHSRARWKLVLWARADLPHEWLWCKRMNVPCCLPVRQMFSNCILLLLWSFLLIHCLTCGLYSCGLESKPI